MEILLDIHRNGDASANAAGERAGLRSLADARSINRQLGDLTENAFDGGPIAARSMASSVETGRSNAPSQAEVERMSSNLVALIMPR